MVDGVRHSQYYFRKVLMALCDLLDILLQFLDHRAAVTSDTSNMTRGKLRYIVFVANIEALFFARWNLVSCRTNPTFSLAITCRDRGFVCHSLFIWMSVSL